MGNKNKATEGTNEKPTTLVQQLMFFYGETKGGYKLHMGNFILSQVNRQDIVDTFCGSEMTAWNEGERPPASRVADFCKNCFRTYAWQIMVVEVGETAKLYDAINDLIEQPFISIETMKDKLRALVQHLQVETEEVMTPIVPKGKEGPTLRVAAAR